MLHGVCKTLRVAPLSVTGTPALRVCAPAATAAPRPPCCHCCPAPTRLPCLPLLPRAHPLCPAAWQVVALHQERYMFPCTITVSKVSGSGADAVFMGVLKPMPAVPDVVQAWIVPAGALRALDNSLIAIESAQSMMTPSPSACLKCFWDGETHTEQHMQQWFYVLHRRLRPAPHARSSDNEHHCWQHTEWGQLCCTLQVAPSCVWTCSLQTGLVCRPQTAWAGRSAAWQWTLTSSQREHQMAA